jgi:diaminopimelate epimerase
MIKEIPFCKFHGFGNDYIVIEARTVPKRLPLGELASAMCHRNTGVGADGIAVLKQLYDGRADYDCEIVNPDGSIAGFSGNGTRCAVAYLHFRKLWSAPSLHLRTRSGIKNYKLLEHTETEFWFEAEIGKPRFASDNIPVRTLTPSEAAVDQEVDVEGVTYRFSAVNVGNPVACIFVDDFDSDWRKVGQILESHEVFPERANIVFVKVIDRGNIEIRIWERGAGETSASGTCASGAAVLSAYTDRTGRAVNVRSEGGSTGIQWRDDDEIVITGRADLAFCGTWPIAA